MTRQFVLERPTKNTYRYQEVVPVEGTPMCGVIYVQKDALPTKPQRISVTIEEVPVNA